MEAAPEARRSPEGRASSNDESPGIQINDTVEIRCGLDHVFDFLSDGERLPAWMAGVKRAKRLSGPGLRGPNAESGLRGPNAESGLRGPNAESGPLGSGTGYRIVGKALGRRVESHYELTAYEPRRRFSSRMESKFFCLEQTYTFEEVDGITKVSLAAKAIPLGRFKLLGPFLFVAMQRQVSNDHRKLKSVLERSRGPARSGPIKRKRAATVTEG